MNVLNLLASSLSAPNDLWTIIINWIQGGVLNYGWTILLFTLLVKVVMSPLDFVVKFTTKKQTLVQQKCAPEIAKLNKKFGKDQQTLKVQTNSLYKREGLNMGIGCIVMLVNLVLTMVVFFTLYSSLRKVSAYQSITNYEQVQSVYDNTYYDTFIDLSNNDDSEITVAISTREDVNTYLNQYLEYKTFVDNPANDNSTDEWKTKNEFVKAYDVILSSSTNTALAAATDKWNEIKPSWLWIENIWVADAVTSPFPNYESLLSIAKNGGKEYENYVAGFSEEQKDACNKLSNSITTNTRAQNGFYIIAILAALVTLASQFLTSLHNKLKNKQANSLAKSSEKANGMSMKMMMIILPIVMLIFALTTGAGFGIYIVSSSLASIILGEITTPIINALTKKKRMEVEEYLEKEANRLAKKGQMKG